MAAFPGIPVRMRMTLFDVANHSCELCGGHQGIQIHHIIPRRYKKSSTNTLNNLIVVCERCHNTKARAKAMKETLIKIHNGNLDTYMSKLSGVEYAKFEEERNMGAEE